MSTSGFDKVLLGELQALLAPLAVEDRADVEKLFDLLGWDLNALAGLDVPALLALGRTLIDAAERAATGTDSLQETASRLFELRDSLASLGRSLSDWSPPGGLATDAAQLLAEDVVHALFDTYLAARLPVLRASLVLAGALTVDMDARSLRVGAAPGRVVREARRRPRLRPERLRTFLQDPMGTLTGPAGTGLAASDAIADLLFPVLVELLQQTGLAADYGGLTPIAGANVPTAHAQRARHLLHISFWAPGANTAVDAPLQLQTIFVGIAPDPADNGHPMLMISSTGAFSVESTQPGFRAGASLHGLPRTVRLGRQGIVSADPASRPAFRVFASRPGSAGGPALRIGDAGLHLSVGEIELEGGFLAGPPPDLSLRLAMRDVKFGLGADGRDDFISELMPSPADSTAGGDLSLSLSLRDGVSFAGRAEFARVWHSVLSTPVLSLGPAFAGLRIDQSGLGIRVEGTVQTNLGPLSITIQDIGLRFDIGAAPPGAPGGGLMPGLRLSGPKGVGLSLDAGPVKGGGYLFFDPDNAQYAGAVQLSVKALSFNAVGVVTTRLPDGSDGFSMLVIITAEFPPIQLGFGFSLIGIGGLAGIHRNMDQDALAQCLREGRLGSILFPRDVVANVRAIVDDIRTVFPPQRDRHVFGPMVKIGWGANALLEMDVAVLLSLPSPIVIAILGRMRAALPTKDDPVVDLRLEVLGLIDLGRAKLTIEARLVDSRIAAFAVTGGMAMLLSWGATKAFVLSVGGFNRRFLPPPDFHAPARMAIALSSGENPTFTLSSYFAITSNAVQFGAGADFHLQADTALGNFSLAAYAQFDVLLIFDPPFFAADLIAGIEVKRNGATLFLARLEASLTGPEPWRISGFVEVQIVVPLRIPFDHTLGEPASETPPAGIGLIELQQKLTAEIARAENWAALPVGEDEAIVSMRRVEAMPGTMLVHPLGGVGFRQRLLPLEKSLRRFGAATVSAPGGFSIEGLVLAGSAIATHAVFDDFAPGEFESLSDDEKLTRPAFETLAAGIEAEAVGVGLPQRWDTLTDDSFEETVINPDSVIDLGASILPGLGYLQAGTHLLGDAGAAAISVRPERYVLAEPDTLQTHPGGEAAYAQLEDARRGGDAGSRVTVPAHEAIVVIEA